MSASKVSGRKVRNIFKGLVNQFCKFKETFSIKSTHWRQPRLHSCTISNWVKGSCPSGGLMENLNYFVRSVFAVSVVSQYVSRQEVFKIALDTRIWPTWPFSHIVTILKVEKSQLWLSHLPSKSNPKNEANPKKSKANPIFLPPGTAQSAWYSPAEQGSAFLAPLCCQSPPPGLFSFS